MKYDGPWISQLGRDGLVDSGDHFVFFTVGAKPAGLKSTLFLGTDSASCHVCICSRAGEIYFSAWIIVGPKETPFCLSSACGPCPVKHHLGTRGQSSEFLSFFCRHLRQVSPSFGPSASPSKRRSLGPLQALPFPHIHWKVLLGGLDYKVFLLGIALIYWASRCWKILSRKQRLKFLFLLQMGCLNKIQFYATNTEG